LRRLWLAGYRLAGRAWAGYLARGERGASTYLRGSISADDALPGLSDVDVAVVLEEDPAGPGVARLRARRRWMRARRIFPLVDLLLDYPVILERGQLTEVLSASVFTLPDGSAYYGPGFSEDRMRMLVRPGLYGPTHGWQSISGPPRLPGAPARSAQERRLAGWLELVDLWRLVPPACADPGPRTASLCVKLVSESARIWLWLVHGWKGDRREEVLREALDRLPEEEPGLRLALELHRRLHLSPEPPLGDVLPVLTRMSRRIVARLAEEVQAEGATEVRLAGTAGQLILPHGVEDPSGLLPLCDWRSLAHPALPDETFFVCPGEPSDPESLRAASATYDFGPLPVLRSGELMVSAGLLRWRTEMRALGCALSDPVSFAVADGRETAAFPNVAGWSAQDWARRAVAEHRAWLEAPPAPVPGLRPEYASAGILAMLLTAARAALFHESVCADAAPELPLTLEETVRRLAQRSARDTAAAEDALGAYRDFAPPGRIAPPQATVDALRTAVERMPAYLDSLRDPARLAPVEQ
jgi:hypothetical protein